MVGALVSTCEPGAVYAKRAVPSTKYPNQWCAPSAQARWSPQRRRMEKLQSLACLLPLHHNGVVAVPSGGLVPHQHESPLVCLRRLHPADLALVLRGELRTRKHRPNGSKRAREQPRTDQHEPDLRKFSHVYGLVDVLVVDNNEETQNPWFVVPVELPVCSKGYCKPHLIQSRTASSPGARCETGRDFFSPLIKVVCVKLCSFLLPCLVNKTRSRSAQDTKDT